MIKKISFILALSLLTAKVFAQSKGFRYGGHLGIGTSDFKKDDGLKTSPNLCFNVGLAASKQFNKHVALNINLLVAKKGAEVDGVIYDNPGILGNYEPFYFKDEFHLYYAEIPILGKASVGVNDFYLKAFAGPSFNFHLYALQNRNYDDPNYNEKYAFNEKVEGAAVMETAMIFGAGLEVETKGHDVYSLEIRSSKSFNSFNKIANSYNPEDTRAAFNTYFTICLSYLYSYDY